MKKNIDAAIIIVNWNGKHLLQECLSSLFSQARLDFEVVLVDNGSVDDSVGFVREKFPQVKIVELEENTGFAKGNNVGISIALQNKNIDNIILLNNDTKVDKNFIKELISYKQHGGKTSVLKVGALVPKMLLGLGQDIDDSQIIIDSVGTKMGRDGRSYNIGHGEIDKGKYNKTKEVFGFCGGAVLLKREMLKDVLISRKWKVESIKYKVESRKGRVEGRRSKVKSQKSKVKNQANDKGSEIIKYQEYFDDNFFAYYEDADLSWRMRWRGWKIIAAPKAVVWHLHSATTNTVKSKTFKAYYLNRNRFLMMLKNFPNKMLWRGLWLVPKSYFNNDSTGRNRESSKKQMYGQENKNSFSTSNRKDNEQNRYTLIGGNDFSQKIKNIWRKKRMFLVLAKVAGSLMINLPKIIKQRRIIQKSRLVKTPQNSRPSNFDPGIYLV